MTFSTVVPLQSQMMALTGGILAIEVTLQRLECLLIIPIIFFNQRINVYKSVDRYISEIRLTNRI